jgi:hypothetical protein
MQMSAGERQNRGKGHGARTAAVRERAILALLSERTIASAAAQCSLGESTLRRWLTEDGRIASLTARAVATLEELLGDTEHPSVRLGAARTVVDIGMHQHEADTIIRRLEEIEAALERRRR